MCGVSSAVVALTSLLLFMCGVSSAVVALTFLLLLFMCGVSSAVVALTSFTIYVRIFIGCGGSHIYYLWPEFGCGGSHLVIYVGSYLVSHLIRISA